MTMTMLMWRYVASSCMHWVVKEIVKEKYMRVIWCLLINIVASITFSIYVVQYSEF